MLQSSFDDAESMITTLLNQYDSFIVENDEKYNDYITNKFRESFIKSMVDNRILPEKYARALFYPITDEKKRCKDGRERFFAI